MCDFHCEDDGWLVADGIVDRETGALGVSDQYFLLLHPIDYISCPCNPLWSRNDEIISDGDLPMIDWERLERERLPITVARSSF